eukprot:TRINITY_DN4547_c0_g1_i1.p1 TRINITY_DN4547_c0_g1~~TRINITY_DN4547_c0_g1_i1.p1  ORF type:complete len:398 (+),score=80.13 TRINITY_DN4547_c0_g1_i1:135-1328(+)
MTEESIQKALYDEYLPEICVESAKVIYDRFTGQMWDCKYSVDGKYLAIVNSTGFLMIFDGETANHLTTFQYDKKVCFQVDFSPNNQFLVVCFDDMSIIIYNVGDFSKYDVIINFGWTISIKFSHCSRYIYSSDVNGYIKKWDIENKEEILVNAVHSDWIYQILACNDEKYILTLSTDKTVKLINTVDFSIVYSVEHKDILYAMAYNADSKFIATGTVKSEVNLWDYLNGSHLHSFFLEGQIFALEFVTPYVLVVMSGDGYITLYDTSTHTQIQRVHCGCDKHHFSMAVSPNRHYLTCGRCDNVNIKMFSFTFGLKQSSISNLIENSKNNQSLLRHAISIGLKDSIIRQLIVGGVHMDKKGFDLAINSCWDLVQINESNGGNMNEFIDNFNDESEDDE